MAGRAYTTEAVVLRSMRLGEADRVLHLYTEAHGRVGAVAKGVRKTMSRFGARLEPLSHVDLVLHRGRGELQTVTAAQLVRSHRETREDYYRFSVGMIGAEAMLRLFSEEEANERAFTALTRFLDLLDAAPHAANRPTLDPLGLAFQLKLLWVAGYLPHVTACAECGAEREPLVGGLIGASVTPPDAISWNVCARGWQAPDCESPSPATSGEKRACASAEAPGGRTISLPRDPAGLICVGRGVPVAPRSIPCGMPWRLHGLEEVFFTARA